MELKYIKGWYFKIFNYEKDKSTYNSTESNIMII